MHPLAPTSLLRVALLLAIVPIAAPAGASTFDLDPNSGGWKIRIAGAPPLDTHRPGPGTASLTGGSPALIVDASVWTTMHKTWREPPLTSLFTGVPLLERIDWGVICTPARFGSGMCSPLWEDEITGPVPNPALEAGTGSIPNPVGPGMLTGWIGYGGIDGSVDARIVGGAHFPMDLALVGASNAAVDTWSIGGSLGGLTIEATLGPWVTDAITITGVTTNLVSAFQRDPPAIGVAFTLQLQSFEPVRTFLNSTWETANGFHPPFTYVAQWREWTFAQTVSGQPGTHAAALDPIPRSRLVLVHTVTVTSGGIEPSSLVSSTGSVSLVTPMRIDTSEAIANVVPGVLRLKFHFVPEPGTLLLLGLGIGGLCGVGLLRRRGA